MKQQLEKTLYEILGVNPDASYEEIKNTYRLLVKQQHPDTGGEATTDEFMKITNAYRILSNPSLRRAYDSSITKSAGNAYSTTNPSTKNTNRLAFEALRRVMRNSIYAVAAYGAELFWIIRAYAVYALIAALLLAVIFVVLLIQ